MSEIKIMSIESTGDLCGINITYDNSIVAEYNVYLKNFHDKLLAKNVKTLLSDLEIELNELDAVAVSAGPGSFTGLRVGSALAKALCFDGSPKLISVPTMTAFANGFSDHYDDAEKDLVVLINSHQKLYYRQIFKSNGEAKTDIEMKELDGLIEEHKDINLYLGPDNGKTDFDYLEGLDNYKTEFISELAYKLYKEEKFVEAEAFTPLYVQKFVVK